MERAHGGVGRAGLAAFVAFGCATVAMAEAPTKGPLEGSYVPASVEADKAALEAAIERTAAPFFFAIRPLVRSRLRETNPIFASIEIRTAGAVVDCNTPPVRVVDADDGVASTVTGLDDKPNSATHQLVGDALVQRTWNAEGARVTRFAPVGPDGLVVAVAITSPRLSVPLRYEMHYRRVRP